MPAPVASGWSGCRVGFAPTGKRRLCTAHTLNGHWQRKPLSQPNCRTHRISCLYGKVDMVCSLKFLISYRTWIRASVGAYNTLRDTLVLLISPMGREVAATFLPHPAPRNAAIHFRGVLSR
jgi:hypothetical protein